MGDVEDMIGTLEEDDDAEDEAKAKKDKADKDDEEGAFGLDLDKAWTSPQTEDG